MEKQKNKGGRPRIEIDLETLADQVSIFCTKEECAKLLGCSEDTIDRRLMEQTGEGFAAFFEKHSADGKASLRRAQYNAALRGNATMLVWLGKQYLGQKDQHDFTVREAEPFDGLAITRAESDQFYPH